MQLASGIKAKWSRVSRYWRPKTLKNGSKQQQKTGLKAAFSGTMCLFFRSALHSHLTLKLCFLAIGLGVFRKQSVDGLGTQLHLGRTQEGGSVGAHSDGAVWGPRPAALPCLKSPGFIQSGASAAECIGLSRTILILRDEA